MQPDRVLSLVIFASLLGVFNATPLDDYINKADPSYDYTVLEDYTRRVDGVYTVYLLNMTSQTWLSSSAVDRSVWWHYLSVTIPDEIVYPDLGFMYITGGKNTDSPPDPLQDVEILLSSIASASVGCVGSTMRQNPNQPIVFKEDPKNKSRSEDSAIAYTWNHFIVDDPNQPEYLLQLPMTKAAIRGFDTIADWSHKINPALNLTKFVPAGGSKRGWVTWLTGAVDKRVMAMAPIVFDLLNLVENLHHHYQSLGGWTLAFNDYYEEDITDNLDDDNTKILADIIDPLVYRDRLTMPKYILSGSNDQFFLPDDSHYYFDQMQGPTYMRIVANAEHSMTLHYRSLLKSITAFMVAVKENWELPIISWKRYENASHAIIDFSTNQVPTEIKAWKARSLQPGRRDWRLMVAREPGNPDEIAINPSLYRSFDVAQVSASEYKVAFHRPYQGWLAFFIEAAYPAPKNSTVIFTTEMHITPNGAWCVPDCQGEACKGIIV